MNFLPDAPEMIARNTNGTLMPMPNTIKFSKLARKLLTDVLTANKIANEAGLHGNTIAPKNKPNTNELQYGLCNTGVLALGIQLPESTLKMSKMEMIANTPKAMGEIMLMTLVKLVENKPVKINPTRNIDKITPAATIHPNKITRFFAPSSSGNTLFAKYAKNPGYNGKTQTAPSGANNPAKNAVKTFAIILAI
jgi:hypothetical protein